MDTLLAHPYSVILNEYSLVLLANLCSKVDVGRLLGPTGSIIRSKVYGQWPVVDFTWG